MDENELLDALLRGHESLYATSPTFRANLDFLVAWLPSWVRGMATEAESVRGQEYAAYTRMLRENAPPIPVELLGLDEKSALTWRERAKKNGVMDRVRERMEEFMKEEPLPPEEFDHILWLYRQGWDGDPATRQDYERNDNDA